MKLWHYPLRQGVGAPAVPVVQPGDHVRRGALIAAAPADALGAPIHASITGLVRSTEGTIVIEGERAEDYEKLAPAAPLSMLRASGLIGLGGAGFPTWMKYRSPLPAGGTVIVNAAECEPILSHNLLRAERQPDGIVRGLCLAMDLAQAAMASSPSRRSTPPPSARSRRPSPTARAGATSRCTCCATSTRWARSARSCGKCSAGSCL